MSQRAQDLGLPRVWHLPAAEGPLRSACGQRERVMRGEEPERHDHKLTHNVDLCSCLACAVALMCDAATRGDPQADGLSESSAVTAKELATISAEIRHLPPLRHAGTRRR